MRRSARIKMRKLEEIAIVALLDERCFFCEESLIGTLSPRTDYPRFLSGTDKAQFTELTVHHDNENRRQNVRSNLKFCHRACHKAHHNKARHLPKADRRRATTATARKETR